MSNRPIGSKVRRTPFLARVVMVSKQGFRVNTLFEYFGHRNQAISVISTQGGSLSQRRATHQWWRREAWDVHLEGTVQNDFDSLNFMNFVIMSDREQFGKPDQYQQDTE